jgi:hypothetical protein
MIQNNAGQLGSEPLLPDLPVDFMANKPKLSGACPSKATLLMFLAAIPISIIVGMAAHYVGIAVGYLAGLVAMIPSAMASVCGVVLCMFVVFAFIVVIAVFLGYPLLVGYLNGAIVAQLGKKGLCRNDKAAAWAGLWNGVFVFLGHAIICFLLTRTVYSMTVSKELIEGLGNSTISQQNWFLAALAAVEFIMILIGGYWGGKQTITEAAFCEVHQKWYTPWRQGIYGIDSKEPVALAIQENDIQFLDKVTLSTAMQYPHLILKTRSCPVGLDCTVEMRGDVFWQIETVNKKGEKGTENKSKLWFDVMADATFARQVEEKLNLKEVKAQKKEKKVK